jgi:hypothetical protein
VATDDGMKKYLIERGLRRGSDFAKAIGIEPQATLEDLLHKAHAYIAYEEKEAAINIRNPRANSSSGQNCGPSRGGGDRKNDELPREKNRGPTSQFTSYTPLIASREHILDEVTAAEYKNYGVRMPKQVPPKRDADKTKWCRHHKTHGHVTEECIQLKDVIEILIRACRLNQYIKEDNPPRRGRPTPLAIEEAQAEDTGPKQVALSITRPEDFYISGEVSARLSKWENFPSAMVITCGGFNNLTVGSVKRKFDELISASSKMSSMFDTTKRVSVPLSFYLEELPGGSPNSQIPLLIQASMANFDVHRILVDEGSSCDIMYSSLFQVLQLDQPHLSPYLGSDLQGFNGSTSKPWGYVDLLVRFGQGEASKQVRVKFLVVDCSSLYQCIIGRTTLAELVAVPSTVHLKMKYYTSSGKVATIYGDIEAARRCFEAASKGSAAVNNKPSRKEKSGTSKSTADRPKLPADIRSVDLDSRFSKREHKEEKMLKKVNMESDEASKQNYRPIPDGEFEVIPLGEDPSKGVKIGDDLPELVKK